MVPIEKTFEIDGVRVTLIRDEQGAHWKCSACQGRCPHIMKAAAWITLQNFAEDEEGSTRMH